MAFNAEKTKCGGVDLICIILHFPSDMNDARSHTRYPRADLGYRAIGMWEAGLRETLWGMLGRKLRSSPTQPNTLSQLADRLKTTWNEMLQDVADLIDSMPRRVRAVNNARGG